MTSLFIGTVKETSDERNDFITGVFDNEMDATRSVGKALLVNYSLYDSYTDMQECGDCDDEFCQSEEEFDEMFTQVSSPQELAEILHKYDLAFDVVWRIDTCKLGGRVTNVFDSEKKSRKN